MTNGNTVNRVLPESPGPSLYDEAGPAGDGDIIQGRKRHTGRAFTPSIIDAKKKWMPGKGEYVFEEQSSMKGAAMLALKNLKER